MSVSLAMIGCCMLQWYDVSEPGYEDFRAEAHNHQRKRQECLAKSQAAREKKMYGVSQHYSDMVSSIVTSVCSNRSLLLQHYRLL